jgi:hypothetical protein
MGIPGEKGALLGERGGGGSIGTGDSLRRANLTVGEGYVCCRGVALAMSLVWTLVV